MHRWIAAATIACVFSAPSLAQDDVKKRLDKMEQDYAELKKQFNEKGSHSSLENAFERMHFHGYGEVQYKNGGTDATALRGDDVFNVHHLVIGMEYEFREDLRMDFEIDFEDGADEVEVEYAYVEWDLCKDASVRVGSLLMPVGRLNERHEPTNYYSVERPYVERSIIPTTWQEVGVGIAGRCPMTGMNYRLVLVDGLDAQDFTAADGLRDGRQGGRETVGEDLAVAGRLEANLGGGFNAGASAYYGGADQEVAGLGRITVTIAEADVHWRGGDLEITGSAAHTRVTNAENIFALTGEMVGSRMTGWYGEAAYHVMPLINPADTKGDLVVFLRREQLDTNDSMPFGVTKDPTADRKVWTSGVAYYPIHNVVFKTDVERWRDDAGNSVTRFNLGVGWDF